ncbi:transposase [Gluconacetobacter asukensis]|uniref:Transposase n=1 Tax=Gluconacetobacter asukensis TaxID=1017181 RepID=A0A7W4J3P0_9PROT|nr:transposase [Gluconacetobacter asukensis]
MGISGGKVTCNPTSKIIISYDAIAYRLRNRIERCFSHLSHLRHFRRFATRYDRRTIHFTGFVHLASAMIWMA